MNIDRIRKNIVGDYGLASSNQYHISFEIPVGINSSGDGTLTEFMANRGFDISGHSNPEVFGRNDIVVDNMVKLSFSFCSKRVGLNNLAAALAHFLFFPAFLSFFQISSF